MNNVVAAARDPKIGHEVVQAYVAASRMGFRILAGIAVLQLVLCLGLKKVVLQDGSKQEREEVELRTLESTRADVMPEVEIIDSTPKDRYDNEHGKK